MSDSVSLILVVSFSLLGLAVGVLIAWAKVQMWKERVNPRLSSHNLYWDFFRLYDIPENEREAFFIKRNLSREEIQNLAAQLR